MEENDIQTTGWSLANEKEALLQRMNEVRDTDAETYVQLATAYAKLSSLDTERIDATARLASENAKLAHEINATQRPKLDPNNVLGAVTNVGGILAVLHYEQLHVIASKAWSMVIKPGLKFFTRI